MGLKINIGRVITLNGNGTGEILCLIGKPSGIIIFKSSDITNIKVDSVVSFVIKEGIAAITPIMIELEEPEQDG